MKKMRILAAATAAMLALMMTACGSNTDTEEVATTTAAVEDVADVAEDVADEEVADASEAYILPVTFVNNTGVTFAEFYTTASSLDNWGENVVAEPIADGEAFTAELVVNAETLVWDFRVLDSEGTELPFYGADFSGCENGATVTFTFDFETATGNAQIVAAE